MGRKTDKAFEAMRESNRLYLEDMKKKEASKTAEGEECDPSLTPEQLAELKAAEEKAREFHEKEGDDERVPLEKGDIPAMILSALMVFGPVFLILLAILLAAIFLLH